MMHAILSVILFSVFLLNDAGAALFKVKIELNQFDEEFSEIKHPKSWKRLEEGGVSRTFEVKSLPWRTQVGLSTFEISKDGVFRAGYSYGDSDGTASTAFSIPKSGGKFVLGDRPCELALAGGDQASGAWGVDAKITISVIEPAPDAVREPSEQTAEMSDAEWEEAKGPNFEGYAKMDEDLQQWADDPEDPRKFRVVATLVEGYPAGLKTIEAWLQKNFRKRGLRFWISKTKKTVTLYGSIRLVTEALGHPLVESASAN